MGRGSFSRRSYNLILAFAIAALLATQPATATELVREAEGFLITRDFQRFTIPALASVFFKTSTPWGVDEPDAEIRAETRRVLANQLNFVGAATEARYELHIRLEEYRNYAIRNNKGRPTQGFVMFAACALPFKETSESCQNLTFYYFESQSRLTAFRRAAEA